MFWLIIYGLLRLNELRTVTQFLSLYCKFSAMKKLYTISYMTKVTRKYEKKLGYFLLSNCFAGKI